MLMKLVDLSTQIYQDRAQIESNLAGQPYSGVAGAMHLTVTTEGDENTVMVVVVPLQNTPGDSAGYGVPQWGPAPSDVRAVEYHDPYLPGSVMTDTDGTAYVWKRDEGFVPVTSIPGAATFGPRIAAIHKAVDDLASVILAAKK